VIAEGPLLGLLQRSFPGVEIMKSVVADPATWQWHCPLLSLPLAFGTTLENIPAHTPYLVPDPARVDAWKSKIAALNLPAGVRKIGVAWKPGAAMKIAKFKAVAFQQLLPLLEQPGTAWFSLQKDPDPDSTPGKLVDWSAEFRDFDDTAALMMNLDLIISVDTSVAHLAGGLNLPTWLLNRYASDWRWMRDRDDSPWYPSMRIFTQEKAGDWESVVKRMIAEGLAAN
jgi:ADP-heptose:LPS heptosyltransferase